MQEAKRDMAAMFAGMKPSEAQSIGGTNMWGNLQDMIVSKEMEGLWLMYVRFEGTEHPIGALQAIMTGYRGDVGMYTEVSPMMPTNALSIAEVEAMEWGTLDMNPDSWGPGQ